MNEEQILCACSAYEQKYYFNPRYQALPTAIQEELKIMAVTLTADVGGVFEIGSHLKIKQYRGKYAELLENLETFYHIFMLQDEEKKKAVLEETNDTSN